MGEYLGLEVIIDLLDGQQVKGVIAAVSPSANLLQLTDAVVGESVFPRLELVSNQISNITIVEDIPTIVSSKNTVDNKKFNHANNHQNTKTTTATSSAASSRQSTPRKTRGGWTGGRGNEWSDTDVSRFQEIEFDIQGSLHRFDKQKIFSEMREKDRIRPEDRLVSHNISQRKLTPQQRVLESRVELDDFDEILVSSKSKVVISDIGQIASCKEVMKVIKTEQVIEIGAFSLFNFVIDTFGGVPLGGIFINIENDLTGAIVASSARHFLNRNVKVYLKIESAKVNSIDISTLYSQLISLGVEVVKNTAPRSYSIAFTSFPLTTKPKDSIICGLRDSVTDCRWMIHFGIVPSSSIKRDTVVCDVGVSPKILCDIVGVNIDYFCKGNCYSIIKK